MHGSPVLLDEVRVTPDEVKDGFHHICVPSPPPNGPEWLGELVGFFIKWSIHLVELCELDEVRVTPDEVKDGFHHICVPSPPPNGPEWIGELVGFFIKWSIHLVELCEVSFIYLYKFKNS
jgi:hypothetical protein